jgi:hypothetical protein
VRNEQREVKITNRALALKAHVGGMRQQLLSSARIGRSPASVSFIRVMRVSSNPSSFAKSRIADLPNKRLPNGESHVPGERRLASGPNGTPRRSTPEKGRVSDLPKACLTPRNAPHYRKLP